MQRARSIAVLALLAQAGFACTINSAMDTTGNDAGASNRMKPKGVGGDDDGSGITKLGAMGMAGSATASDTAGANAGAGGASGHAGSSSSAGAGGLAGTAAGGSASVVTHAPSMPTLPTCDTELPLPSLATDATLESGKCYLVTGDVSVSAATLTVQPGVTLKFKQNASLTISGEGAISAIGSADEPISFIGSITEPGHWLSLVIASDNPKNELAFTQFAHGGSGAACCRTGRNGATLVVTDQSRVSVSDSVFTSSGRDAIEFEPGAKIVKFERNAFFGNMGGPVRLPGNRVGNLDAASNYAGSTEMPNQDPYIEVAENTVGGNATWPATNLPYRAPAGFAVGAKLTLSPGVTIEFPDDQGIAIGSMGQLHAAGTKDQHITLHGTHAGRWLGLLISSPDDTNALQFVDLDGGGSARWCCDSARGIGSLMLDKNAVIAIEDSSFTNGASAGLYAMDGATLKSFVRNSFAMNHDAPVYVRAMHLTALDASSSFKGGNDEDRVVVVGGSAGTGTWTTLDVPYHVSDNVHLDGDVVISAGAKFVFDDSVGLWVNAGGSLSAITQADEITFSGVNDQAGFWLGLGFASNSPRNVLDGVTIDGGGSAAWCCDSARRAANLIVDPSGGVTVRNSKISRSAGFGLYKMAGAASLTQSGNSFSSNASGDVGP